MRRFFQIGLPLLVLGSAGFFIYKIVSDPVKPKTKKSSSPPVFVEVQTAVKTNFPVKVETQGEVRPRIMSKIIPEVSGKVIAVSDNFFAGKFFKKGETLLQIDPRDYETSLTKAKTELIKAQTSLEQEKVRTKNFDTAIINAKNILQKNILTLKEEEARAEQALIDWKRLGNTGSPGELVLRRPQLDAAKAAVEAAKAEILKAQRDLTLVDTLIKNASAAVEAAKAEIRQKEINLERCTIMAPFDGRVISKSVNIGQYTSPGNAIADIYSIDAVEVRLPLSSNDLQFIALPGDSPEQTSSQPEVILSMLSGKEKISWEGIIDRTEGQMDPKSRQHYVIGRVNNPFSGENPLKPGTFVKAEIHGRTLNDVFIVPISSLRESSYLWLVDENSKLTKRPVEIQWRDMEIAVLKGLKDGDKICITTLTFAREGLAVTEKGSKKNK